MNCKITINNTKIFNFTVGKQGKAWGVLAWPDGTTVIEQKFQTNSQPIIDLIQANQGIEANYKADITISQTPGYGDHAGKTFNNWVIIGLELTGPAKEFNLQEIVDQALAEQETEETPW
jgi:hypothetical protein